jgi:hypothetical protein
MLHIPRDGRLKDPVNLRQMIEIEQAYPRLFIVHGGLFEGDLNRLRRPLPPLQK